MKSALTLWLSQEYHEDHEVNETAHIPSIAEAPLPPPSKIIDLNVFFDTMDNNVNRAMFNNVTYNAHIIPSLLTELSMGENAGDVRVYWTNSFVLQHNEVVELRVFNWGAGKHPLSVSLSLPFLRPLTIFHLQPLARPQISTRLQITRRHIRRPRSEPPRTLRHVQR